MSYILLVNPQVLRTAGLSTDNSASATALVGAMGTIVAGVLANLPIAFGPGMGLNTYMASAVAASKISTSVALTSVLLSGIISAICALFSLTTWLMSLFPRQLKSAIMIGLGFYQAFIGATGVGLVVEHYFSNPPIQLGNIWTWPMILTLLGLLSMGMLMVHGVPGAMLIGITAVTLIAWIARLAPLPPGIIAAPVLTEVAHFDFGGYFSVFKQSFIFTLAITIIAMCDIGGVLYACGRLMRLDVSDLEDDRLQTTAAPNPTGKDNESDLGGISRSASEDSGLSSIDDSTIMTPNAVRMSFLIIGLSTALSGLFSCSPVILFLEASAGIKEGARTGLAAVVTGTCLLLSIFFIPLFGAVPKIATSPVLILLGALMMQGVKQVDWGNMRVGLPCFLTVAMMPFTADISVGIAFGVVSYILLHVDLFAVRLYHQAKNWQASRGGRGDQTAYATFTTNSGP